MITQEGANVFVSGIDGNFDDAQTGVKKIFTDEKFGDKLEKSGFVLSSANSINWGRLVPQIVYYISAYCDMVAAGEAKRLTFAFRPEISEIFLRRIMLKRWDCPLQNLFVHQTAITY